MSGKLKTLILAMALAVGLMGATKPRYGAWVTASGSSYGAQHHAYVTKTVIFKLKEQGARSMRGTAHRAWDDYFAIADQVVNLPADSLACDLITRRAAYTGGGGLQHYPGGEVDSFTQQRYFTTTQCMTTGLLPNLTTAALVIPKHAVYWAPFEHTIPAGVHIVSAKMMVMTDLAFNEAVAAAGADTITFAALTVPGSGMWRKSPKCYPSVFMNMRTASWDNQWQPEGKGAATTANGYIASAVSDSFPWPLDWDLVTRSIDIGPRSRGFAPLDTIAADSSVAIDITRIVQKWIDGEPNLGMIQLLYSGESGAKSITTHNWGTAAADSGREPWFVVQYLEGSDHVDPWGGKEVAFCFVTDDGRMPYNSDMATIFQSFGAAFTAAICHSAGGTPIKGATNYWKSWNTILAWLNAGMDIASHSKRHLNPNGLAGWDSTVAEQESLLVDINPDWIYAGLDSVDATRTEADFRANPHVARVFALPNNNYTQRALAKLDSMGYVGARTGLYGTIAKGVLPGDTVAAYANGNVLSFYQRNYGLTMPYKVNRFLIPCGPNASTGGGCQYIYGTAASPASEAQVRRSLRLAIENAAVRYNEMLVVFVHDSLGTVTYPNDGVNRTQMWWTLDELINQMDNVKVMALSDAAGYMRSHGRSIAHPTPWGTNDVWESRLGGETGPNRKLWWISTIISQ